MPPKPRHTPDLPDPNQGELFDTEVVKVGGPNSTAYEVNIIDGSEGGMFPADHQPEEGKITLQDLTTKAAIAAAQKLNRREGNRTKHSALGEDGLYHPWVGSYLPGFGPVRERDWEEAKQYAETLNAKRLRERQLQPQLGDDERAADVFSAVAYVASRLDIGNGLKGEKPESTVLPLATTQDKIMALLHGANGGFIPTTNREKNSGFEMMDYLGHPDKYPKGAGQRLLEIFYGQQKVQRQAGKTAEEARDMAFDSVRSVVNEWGDYAVNAKKSLNTLQQIDRALRFMDRRQTLKTAFADETGYTLDLRPLVRFFELKSLPFYPEDEAVSQLTTRTDRTQFDDEKNKTVEDEYTRAHMSPESAKRIDAVLSIMRVADGLRLSAPAQNDQKNRGALWNQGLDSANKAGDFSEIIEPVIARVKAA